GASGGAAQTASGGAGARAGQFQRNADGSASRQGGAAGQTAAGGRFATSGSASTDGQGNGTAVRNTSATTASGNSYQGQTTATTGQGVQHTGTCHDAAGVEIPCPR
ncbi:MAG: hypothetical protein DYH17_13675, partial [Xanthomonadales bacterium PRO6]|nr:hypothetical protein [Xanthomonadales bacterium PRO6]